MKKIILFFTILISCFSVQAQKEAYNWVFGTKGGLSWNTTRSFTVTGITPSATATALNGLPSSFLSSIDTMEGCFSLSDSNGALLFYSDGTNVWNKNNVMMSNSTVPNLTGNNSSVQSGIIFPYPGNPNQFVAVTLGSSSTGVQDNLSYSVIDMTLKSVATDPLPLGNVVAGKKNIRFAGAASTTGETCTSTRIPGTDDYWVLAPSRGASTKMNAWKFTSAGPAAAPVVTNSPIRLNTNINGYLKITPDGKHFVLPSADDNSIVYGDFEITTGVFSNIRELKPGFNHPYGVEFSPDETLLYFGFIQEMRVYKASEFFANANTASYKLIPLPLMLGSASPALQLAPDGRIYIVDIGKNSMYIVDNPNDYGNLKLYRTATGFLGSGALAKIGLPSFAASWFTMKPTAKKFACTGYDYKFTTNVDMSGGANAPVKLSLNYGDGNTGTINLIAGQTDYDITHAYTLPGSYTVTITPVRADSTTLTPSTVTAEAVDCLLRSNRMIRIDLQNTNTATGGQ